MFADASGPGGCGSGNEETFSPSGACVRVKLLELLYAAPLPWSPIASTIDISISIMKVLRKLEDSNGKLVIKDRSGFGKPLVQPSVRCQTEEVCSVIKHLMVNRENPSANCYTASGERL